ncbi:MAG: hypothetical protein JNM43_03620 [Planctomycetaceae bacterium]|nr:hypothetical protein [Planctomycetaceae bacterium]
MDGFDHGLIHAVSTVLRRLTLVLSFSLAVFWISPALAEEPVLEFAQGLRERGYYDTAIEYLDGLTARTDLSPAVKDVLDLERGMTYQQWGATSRDPEQRTKYLGEAEVALKKFLAEHAQHPLAAQANSVLGELLFDRAKSLTWQTTESDDATQKQSLQNEARNLIDQAKVIFQAAHDQYKSQYDSFPKFIDEAKDEEEFIKRKEAESKYLRAWFNLARCTYERGQTFDRGSEERKQTLIQASALFEEIHTKRRTNVIGQHARLMMGKCFQEQDDITRALGIYQDLLGNRSEDGNAKMLQGIAQHYRLICLNDPQKHDYALVIQEATTWLLANRQSSTSTYGLGILWEQAIAEDKLAEGRELPAEEKNRLLESALNHAEQVAKYPGAFRDPAMAMARRLKVVLGEKDREPRDFVTAFERARGLIAQIQELTDELARAANDSERNEKKAALNGHLENCGRLLELALALADAESDPKAVAQARYLLSFIMMRQGNPLDSIVLATYCFTHDQKADPETALNATEVAMVAAVSAWNAAPAESRDFETRLLRDVCQQILTLYPQSSRAGEARMRLGAAYRTLSQPLEAVKWYLEVPETDPQYGSARISAGQCYWGAWTQKAAIASIEGDTSLVSSPDMQKWKAEAKTLLNQGIDILRKKLGENAAPSEELVGAEVSLAEIMNVDGEFAQAIERLTGHGDYSVLKALDVEDESKRPDDGVKGRRFASATYRHLLRAYVGTSQIDQALQAMNRLEKIGGENLLAAYTQLGMELQEELQRLSNSGQTDRLTAVRTSFEQFLQKVYESRNKTDYNSLLWIGETYYGLGQGVKGDENSAAGYFGKAGDAYNEILTGGLASAENKNAVTLRLARCRRQQKSFDEALKLTEEILAQNAMMMDAQFEAAAVLADWGENTEPERLNQAIQGIRDASGKATNVWGWGTLSKRLQQLTTKDPSPEIRKLFFDARYELGVTRRRIARVSKKPEEGATQLRSAMAEISSMVQVFRDIDDVTFARFDKLYQDIQADLGQAAAPLSRAVTEKPPEDGNTPTKTPTEETKTPETVANVPAEKPPEASGNTWLPIAGIVACIAIAGGVFFAIRKPRERVRVPGTPTKAPKIDVPIAPAGPVIPDGISFEAAAPSDVPDFSAFAGIGSPKPARPTTRPAASTGERPARPAGAAPSAGASAAPGPAGGAAPAAPRPRPKPAEGAAPKAAPPAGTDRPKPAAPGDAGSADRPVVRKPRPPEAKPPKSE